MNNVCFLCKHGLPEKVREEYWCKVKREYIEEMESCEDFQDCEEE